MKDSFKPLFCAPSFYSHYQDSFRIIDEAIVKLHWDKTSEVMLWAALLCLLRRPKNWFGGICSTLPLKTSDTIPHFLPYELTQELKIDWPKKLPTVILHLLSFYEQ